MDDLVLPEVKENFSPISVEDAVGAVLKAREERKSSVLFNLGEARTSSPDKENTIKKDAAEAGIPIDSARAFPDDAARRAHMLRLQKMRLAEDYPHTMAFFGDIGNARIAHDDIEVLKQTEGAFTKVSDLGRSFAAGTVSDFAGGVLRGAEETIMRSQYGAMLEAQSMTGGDEVATSGVAGVDGKKTLTTASRFMKDTVGEAIDIPEYRRGRLQNQIARGLGQFAGQLGTALITGGAGSMLMLGGQGAGAMAESLDKDRARLAKEGKTSSMAGEQAAFLGGTAVTALTEKFGLDFVTGKYTPTLIKLAEKYGSPAAMKLLENRGLRYITGALLSGAAEGTQEVTEDLGQTGLRKLFVDGNIAMLNAKELLEEFLVGGAVGFIAHGTLNARSLIKSRESKKITEAATDAAARSKLNERSPETYGKYFKDVAENQGADGAFIRKEAWDAYYQQENMDPALAAERYGIKNYNEATESGDYLEMPLERHGSDFAKTQAAATLKEHTKYFSDPEIVTPYEMAQLEVEQAKIEQSLLQTLASFDVSGRQNLEEAIDKITEEVAIQLQPRYDASTSKTQATLLARMFAYTRMRDELSKNPEATDEMIASRILNDWQGKSPTISANALPEVLTTRKNPDIWTDSRLEKLRRGDVPSQEDIETDSALTEEASLLDTIGRALSEAGINLQEITDNEEVRRLLNDYEGNNNGYGENTRSEPKPTEVNRYEQRGFTESREPTEDERREANRQYDAVVSKYKGTALWMKAPNGAPTKLTERQWVQVRTENFKKWFGDWEKAGIRERLESQKPMPIEAKYNAASPKERRDIALGFFSDNVVIPKTVGDVVISKRGIRNSFSHSSTNTKLDVVPHLAEVLAQAEYIGTLEDFTGKDIQNHYFATRILHNGETKLVFLRVREAAGRDNQLYVHDVFIEDEIKEKGQNNVTKSGYSKDTVSQLRSSSLYKAILQDIYAADNSQVSKNIDENGEPRIDALPENVLYQNDSVTNTPEANTLRGATVIHADRSMRIELFADANFSTFAHESAHFILEDFADMARSENASAYIKEEFARICQYLGADVNGKFTREQHEQFARSFEAYLMEGKAPSIELQNVFRRFKSWMINLYKTLRGLDVTLSKDIREVFDRMLAADEEIEAARAVNSHADAMFATAENMGVSQPLFDAYQKLGKDALESAKEKLLSKLMQQIKKEKTKEWQKELATVKAEVTKAYRALPAFVALETLANPDSDIKLSRKDITDRYGKNWIGKLPKRDGKILHAKNGISADDAASLFGFRSGDEMLDAMYALPEEKAYVNAEADRIMRERYGDLLNSELLPDAAQEALNNEHKTDMLALELKALMQLHRVGKAAVAAQKKVAKESVSATKKSLDLAKEAVRAYAQRTIDSKAIRQIRPNTYLLAARRAAKKAGDYLAQMQYDKAASEKQRELVSIMLYNEATAAQKRIDTDKKKMSRMILGSEKKLAKVRDMNDVYRLRYILAKHGIGSRSDTWMEKLKTAQANGDKVDISEVKETNWRDMAFTEFCAMSDEVNTLWDVSRLSKTAEIDGKRVEVREIADGIVSDLERLGIPDVPDKAKAKETLSSNWKSSLQQVEAMCALLGGEKGTLMRTVFNPMKDASVAARERQREIFKQLETVVSKLKFTKTKITATELEVDGKPYVFGEDINGGAEVFGALLHCGNESNLRKLLLGRKWATLNENGNLDTSQWDAFLNRMVEEGVLTKEHFDAAQAIWNVFESLKHDAQKANKKIFGAYFKEVKYDGVMTPFGMYKGGYVPAKIDTDVVTTAKSDTIPEVSLDSPGSLMPLTQPGFTKARVEDYTVALELDPRKLIGGLHQVINFSHIAPAYHDVRKILENRRVVDAVGRYDRHLLKNVFAPWMRRSLEQSVTSDKTEAARWLARMRSRAGAVLMFGSVKSSLQQASDFIAGAGYVKPGNLMDAVLHHDKIMIAEKSAFMRDRFGSSQSAVLDHVRSIFKEDSLIKKADSWFLNHAYFMQQIVDDRVSSILWTAAYNDALQDGQPDHEAIRHADHIIRRVMMSQNPEDVANVQAGSALNRMFTQFSGFFVTRANLIGTELGRIAIESGAKLSDSHAVKAKKILQNGKIKAMSLLLSTVVIPSMVDTAIALALKGMLPDDDEWMRNMFIGSAGYVSGLGGPYANIAGQMAISLMNETTGGKVSPYGQRVMSSAVLSLIEDAYRQVRLMSNNEVTAERLLRLASSASIFVMPVPLSATRAAAWAEKQADF